MGVPVYGTYSYRLVSNLLAGRARVFRRSNTAFVSPQTPGRSRVNHARSCALDQALRVFASGTGPLISLRPGQVLGCLGPNGSGKSTTVNEEVPPRAVEVLQIGD